MPPSAYRVIAWEPSFIYLFSKQLWYILNKCIVNLLEGRLKLTLGSLHSFLRSPRLNLRSSSLVILIIGPEPHRGCGGRMPWTFTWQLEEALVPGTSPAMYPMWTLRAEATPEQNKFQRYFENSPISRIKFYNFLTGERSRRCFSAVGTTTEKTEEPLEDSQTIRSLGISSPLKFVDIG